MRRTIWTLAAPLAVIALAGFAGCSKNSKDGGENPSGSASPSTTTSSTTTSPSATTTASTKILALKFHHDS